jgi:hypothetical protein
VTHVASNRNARAIFERDVTRVCDYFLAQGIRMQPGELAAELWETLVGDDADDLLPFEDE